MLLDHGAVSVPAHRGWQPTESRQHGTIWELPLRSGPAVQRPNQIHPRQKRNTAALQSAGGALCRARLPLPPPIGLVNSVLPFEFGSDAFSEPKQKKAGRVPLLDPPDLKRTAGGREPAASTGVPVPAAIKASDQANRVQQAAAPARFPPWLLPRFTFTRTTPCDASAFPFSLPPRPSHDELAFLCQRLACSCRLGRTKYPVPARSHHTSPDPTKPTRLNQTITQPPAAAPASQSHLFSATFPFLHPTPSSPTTASQRWLRARSSSSSPS
jgi:hypothetical protein